MKTQDLFTNLVVLPLSHLQLLLLNPSTMILRRKAISLIFEGKQGPSLKICASEEAVHFPKDF